MAPPPALQRRRLRCCACFEAVAGDGHLRSRLVDLHSASAFDQSALRIAQLPTPGARSLRPAALQPEPAGLGAPQRLLRIVTVSHRWPVGRSAAAPGLPPAARRSRRCLQTCPPRLPAGMAPEPAAQRTALVTGASGYAGQFIVQDFAARGWRVRWEAVVGAGAAGGGRRLPVWRHDPLLCPLLWAPPAGGMHLPGWPGAAFHRRCDGLQGGWVAGCWPCWPSPEALQRGGGPKRLLVGWPAEDALPRRRRAPGGEPPPPPPQTAPLFKGLAV